VAQNAKDILPDDSRDTVRVTFDFARREKSSRLQTTVCRSTTIGKIIETKKRSVLLGLFMSHSNFFLSLTRVSFTLAHTTYHSAREVRIYFLRSRRKNENYHKTTSTSNCAM